MSIVTAIIKSEGKQLSAFYNLLSIEINKAVNRIPSAELRFVENTSEVQQFQLSDNDDLNPGNLVEILLRYEERREPATLVFKGVILKQSLSVDGTESILTLSLQDQVVHMTKERKSAVFIEKTDADIFEYLTLSAGIQLNGNDNTGPVLQEIVQHNCSDWDFLLTRAKLNNLLVIVNNGEITLEQLKVPGSNKHSLDFREDYIYNFEMEVDASDQYDTVESYLWNPRTQSISSQHKANEFNLAQGKLNPRKVAQKMGPAHLTIQNALPQTSEESQALADSTLARMRMSFIRGKITVAGIPVINLMDGIKLKGFSKQFDGQSLVAGIRHIVDSDGWVTHVQIGLNTTSFIQPPNMIHTPAAGSASSTQDLQSDSSINSSNEISLTRINTPLSWDDLIISSRTRQEIRSIETWLQHGKTLLTDWQMAGKIKSGYRAFFHGPSGTGKTLTAKLLGKSSAYDVYQINLSNLISKYIGETEKNLAQIFDRASDKNWILFFDEADALFGKRTEVKDSHDRYANQEVSYLLQRIESFNGLSILSFEHKITMDSAFMRRFESIIHFPMPGPKERLRIWQRGFSPKVKLEPSLDLESLARRFELSGGSIMNVIGHASLRALERGNNIITLSDIFRGLRKEYRKRSNSR